MLPDVQIKLGNDTLEPSQCNFGIRTVAESFNPAQNLYTVYSSDQETNSTRDDTTGLFKRQYLFQNYQACIPTRSALVNVTSIGFSSNKNNVSFCLEDFDLLPSEVNPAGDNFAAGLYTWTGHKAV